ncbi:MAG: hypothetical protein JST86_08140 [Bacteroidetes bacterium]|nr:hypothetical protein [Bacteroidota bacterium]
MRSFTKLFITAMPMLFIYAYGMAQQKATVAVRKTPVTVSPGKKANPGEKIAPELNQRLQKLQSSEDNKQSVQQKVAVKITCMVTPGLTGLITSEKGEIISTDANENLLLAKVPLGSLSRIASSPDVKLISPAPAENVLQQSRISSKKDQQQLLNKAEKKAAEL